MHIHNIHTYIYIRDIGLVVGRVAFDRFSVTGSEEVDQVECYRF